MPEGPLLRHALAALCCLAGLAALLGPASAGSSPTSPSAAAAEPAPSTAPAATDATTVPASSPAPAAPVAPVDWLPLRASADGTPMKVGCTYQSRSAEFGYACGGHHDRWALDLIAPTGTPVYATRAGFAIDAAGQPGSRGYGNVVTIDHGDGTRTLYGHLSKVLVPPTGTLVDENTVIGLVGSTGASSAPHLHYEKQSITLGEAIDPGPLHACLLGADLTYPQVAGRDSWLGVPWGAFTIQSDGTDCASAPPARPARPIPRNPVVRLFGFTRAVRALESVPTER